MSARPDPFLGLALRAEAQGKRTNDEPPLGAARKAQSHGLEPLMK